MSGRYFRQNHWKKVERFPASISYAYLLISYEKENPDTNFFNQYYPINVVLTKETISFYSSNLLEYANKNQASLQSYQSQAFLSFSLENSSALEREIERVDKMTSDEVIESLFTFSTDLDYKEIDKSNERKDAIGADFLASLFPDLNGTVKENQRNYYKIIFLNFLNDFFYSNTFKSHPNYKGTRQILEENQTIKAILAKGYYKYALKKNKKLLDEKEVIQKETVKKWKSRLKDAAKNWHALIINKEYTDLIEADKTWFENKETEHKSLMENLYSSEMLDLYEEEGSILSTNQVTDSVRWLSSRYDLLGAFRWQFHYFFKKGWKDVFLFELIFVALVLIICFFGKDVILPDVKFNIRWGFIGLSLLIGGLIISSGIGIVLQRVLVIVGLCFKFLIEAILFYNEKSKPIKEFKMPITSVVLSIPKFLGFFKPRILLASTAIWVAIYASSELWNIDFLIEGVEFFLLIVFLLVFLFFVFSKLKELTKLDSFILFRRSFFLILLGFVYSIGLGISATTIAMKNTFVKEGYYKDFFKKLDNTVVDSTTKKTALQARLDTGYSFIEVTLDTNNTPLLVVKDTGKVPIQVISYIEKILLQIRLDELYCDTKEILYRNVIGKSKLDSIIAYTKPKANADKILLEKILPLLKRTASSDDNCKLVYHIKINMPQWKNANSSKPFFFEFYIVPDFLIFYSIIATVIGMFIELFLKQRE